jgi:hypothetical protein
MKTALLLAVAIVILSSFPFVSREIDASAEERGISSVQASAHPSLPHLVHAELVSAIDEDSAIAGDAVVVETEDLCEAADGTVIPVGSHLIGRLAAVHPTLRLVFDRAESKSGQTVPLASLLEPVALSRSVAAVASASGSPAAQRSFHLDPGTRFVLGASVNHSLN